MECVANYEIEAECSVVADHLVLRIQDPKGLYRARIENIPRKDYAAPFRLSLHLYFDAPSLDRARSVGDELLSDCLNMFAFVTGSVFRRHRTKQIVDATPPGADEMRSVLMWGDSIEHQDPQPFLTEEITRGIERLLEFDLPPAIRRAMRWYRLGINETSPDDQFMYFWFALEIVAEFRKSTEKVSDRCPRCQSPLYCSSCKAHPVHRPYPKQAIRELLRAVDSECDAATIERLEKSRNSLMHGSTLRDIEDKVQEPHEQIVDVLGRLVWLALVHQFPHEMFDGTLAMGFPSTFVHRALQGIAHMQMVVPVDAAGDLDLNFKGFTMELVPPGPPQSAEPNVVNMSPQQYERLGQLRYVEGPHQEMCRRIHGMAQKNKGRVHALILSTDMVVIEDALKRDDTGPWQDLFREIVRGTTEGEHPQERLNCLLHKKLVPWVWVDKRDSNEV